MDITEYTEQYILNKCFDAVDSKLCLNDTVNSNPNLPTQYTEQAIFNRIFDASNNWLKVK